MALSDLLSFAPKGKIGQMDIMASLEEIHVDTMQMTEHPVELGAAITDHAYARPKEVVIRCGWSNSTLSSLASTISDLFAGEMSASDYVSSVYAYLLGLQDSRAPFDVTTSKRQYNDMLLVSLQVTTDQHTSAVLMVQAVCRQIIIVKTKVTTLPSKEAQANPEKTASVEDSGVKQTKAATPQSGGSVPSGGM